MQVFQLLGATAIIAVSSLAALAADNPASPVATPVPGVTAVAPGPAAIPSAAAPTSAPTAAPAASPIIAPAEVIKPIKASLKDGTSIEFEPDGSVVMLGADGSHTEAPDGTLTLKDGTTFAVKGGKKVDE